MNANNKRGNAEVDIILEELKNRGPKAPEPRPQNVDDILAEMGLGGKKAPAAPLAKSAAHWAHPPAPTAQRPANAPPAPQNPPPQHQPFLSAKEEPLAKEPAEDTVIFDAPLDAVQAPRVGKAAARDLVDADKFVGDAELGRWFNKDATLAFSKKDRKQAEKDMMRRLAEDERAESQQRRSAATQKEEPLQEVFLDEDVFDEEFLANGSPDAKNSYEYHRQSGKTPEKKGFFARIFGGKKSHEEDNFAPEDEHYPEDEKYSPGFSSAFDGANNDEEAFADVFEPKAKPRPAKNVTKEPLEADTAAFVAAFVSPKKAAPVQEKPQSQDTWDADIDLAEKSAFDTDPSWQNKSEEWDSEESFFDAASATATFEAQTSHGQTSSFTSVKVDGFTKEEAAFFGYSPGQEDVDTRSFKFGTAQEEALRVPTAAFTQEFGTEDAPEERSLFVDDMVDERFRQFFSETVVAERVEAPTDTKSRKKRKKYRSTILTGEFARMAEMAEMAEQAEKTGEDLAEEDTFGDYDRPQDAPAIEEDIAALKKSLTQRTAITGAISVLLFWMGLSFANVLPLPKAISFAGAPFVFTGLYLALLMAAIIINFTTVATGLVGLFAAPTVDCAPALAAFAGLLQGAMLLVQLINKNPASATLFGCLAAFTLCFNAFGKRIRAVAILQNFKLASAGVDHSAAFVLDSSNELAYNITKGLEEEDPTLLISRPTALVKGFLRQSFSQRKADDTGRTLGWLALVAGLLATALAIFMGKANVFGAVSAFAAVLCIAAPFSSSLVSGVPSLLLQRSTARLGAVVPGWSAIEDLGDINVVMAGAGDIFPTSSIALKGIKTFQKERIDLAILYAASVLIEGCETLRDIFLGVIQGKSDMLYKVESLVQEPGRGFTAWVQNNRVVIGSREMLQKHDVTPPPMELEVKYVPDGHMPVYLAVSGKLFAMFIVSYKADKEVRETLHGLIKSGVSLLVTSNDMNVTNELIEYVYKLPHGLVKVLGRKELEILEPLTSYIPESDGVMTHIGSFASFIGGMRAAAGCAAAEKMSSTVQTASVILAGLLCLLLAFGGALPTLSISIALLYQAAWTGLVSLMPFLRRY